ncbi:MAG: hypothetical protein PVG71_14490 [Anaerolineae bacterium]
MTCPRVGWWTRRPACQGNATRRNSIYGNAGSGIAPCNGGNDDLAAPIISATTAVGASGTARPGCIVDLFSAEEDEGRIHEGTTIADGGGNWTWTGSPMGPYVTATATDNGGNTWPFSAPRGAWRHWVYLPLMLRQSGR